MNLQFTILEPAAAARGKFRRFHRLWNSEDTLIEFPGIGLPAGRHGERDMIQSANAHGLCSSTGEQFDESSGREAPEKAETMKESTLAKITASVAAARGIAQKAMAANPNPDWTEYEMLSIDEWIAVQDVKLDRPAAIRRLVELGLNAKPK